MATAIVSLKVTPIELRIICDALTMYAETARAIAQRHALPVPKVTGDPRRAYALARDIGKKIGFEEAR